ncbi:hypothetical protein B0H14DRAFT_3139598 [Mycena olivaceomarginata]|nr:hypothetical protein B0H14DRAFT_3139598 [Mycena olivaceomarginata]
MPAPPAASQKPLLLPGIAPHLFQSRTPTHRRRKMIIDKNSSPPAGTSPEHSRTPSDDSTAVAAGDDVNSHVTPRCPRKTQGHRTKARRGGGHRRKARRGGRKDGCCRERRPSAAAPRPALMTLLSAWMTESIYSVVFFLLS